VTQEGTALDPVTRQVTPGTTTGVTPLASSAIALMRNEN
jgi:hypothetical protein